MESAACRRRASDAEQSARWTYSATAECEPVAVKEEPEGGECGVSEAAVAEGLYFGHEVKDEVVIGPETVQQQDVAFSMQNAFYRLEGPCSLKPEGGADDTPDCTHTCLGEGPRCNRSPEQQYRLTSCFVRLERLPVGDLHRGKPCSSMQADPSASALWRSREQGQTRSYNLPTPLACHKQDTLNRTEVDPCQLQPAGGAGAAPECTHTRPGEGPRCNMSHDQQFQLRSCSVRLERILIEDLPTCNTCLHRAAWLVRVVVMESAACRRRASDAEQSARWTYSATAECEPVAVKEEPEGGECGVSEAAVAEGLYFGHEVKDEVVIGPETVQQQDVAFSMQNAFYRLEGPCSLKPEGGADDTPDCTHTCLGEGPRCNRSPEQQYRLTSCFVRLERLPVGELHRGKPCSSMQADPSASALQRSREQGQRRSCNLPTPLACHKQDTLNRTEVDPCQLQPAGGAGAAPECTHTRPGEGPRCNMSHDQQFQLRSCSVRLERILIEDLPTCNTCLS
ncbi:hypothetical protein MSG28_014869 [Choristoneura fumiferana]|nr:hypothetical protein MSG28_014869 [Choristoneura fumiferana]